MSHMSQASQQPTMIGSAPNDLVPEIAHATRAFEQLLNGVGWFVQDLHLDFTAERPIVSMSFYRADGLCLYARSDQLGRCCTETAIRERSFGLAPGLKGRHPRGHFVQERFMGRIRHEGARSMLRHVTSYLAANSPGHAVTASEYRRLLGPLLVRPVRLSHTEQPQH